MTVGAFFCEYPAHEGDRHIRARTAQWNLRSTYVRADQGQRIHERNVPNGRRCTRCADLEAGAVDPNQGGLF